MSVLQLQLQYKEIENLKICQHPNIGSMIKAYEDEQFFFIVLEYHQGKDLYDYMLKRKFLITEIRAQELSQQIVSAVQYLHLFGIVHRDLKLENIMMSDETDLAIPKLIDLGLSFLIGPGQSSNERVGTIAYAAPELILSQPYGKSVDVWSLGVIIYVLLSGQLPFEDPDQQEQIRRILSQPINFDSPRWQRVSQEAKSLVYMMLQKNVYYRCDMN